MAQHKSALKRHRQSEKRYARNHAQKSAVRTEVKKARAAAEGGASAETSDLIKSAQIALARAGVKGVFHKRTVARRISRLALLQNRLAANVGKAAEVAPKKRKKAPARKAASKSKK